MISGCTPAQSSTTESTAPATSLAIIAMSANERRQLDFDAAIAALGRWADGTEHVRFHEITGNGRTIAIELSLDRYEARVEGSTRRMPLNGLAAVERGADLVIGSGFVAEYAPITPLGLLQLGGTVVSDLSKHGYTRVVGAQDGALTIVGRAEYHRGLFESAVQIGPGIVEESRLDINERELKLPAYFRAFVASCDGAMLAGITTEPMNLYNVGSDLVAYFEQSGLRCEEVANLSGDRETLLGVDTGDETVFIGDPNSIKASLIGFAKRQPQ